MREETSRDFSKQISNLTASVSETGRLVNSHFCVQRGLQHADMKEGN